MTVQISARYRAGVFVPDDHVNLPENQHVTVILDAAIVPADPPPAGGVELVEWRARHRIQIDPAQARKIIESKEFEYYEEPE